MSRYSVQKYINKKWNDIAQDIPTVKAYNLGMAVGYLQAYRNCKAALGKEKTNEIYNCLDGNDEFSKILRTLIELDDKETASTAERIAEKLEECEKLNKELSDDDRNLLEDVMEFLYQKEQKKEK